MKDLYRVSPFAVSLFSGHALTTLPQMDDSDSEMFLQSLKAETVPELVKTARLWEGELLQRYRVPFFLVRVGDIRAYLNSAATALILYKEAQDQIESDQVFDKFVEDLEQQCLFDEEKHRLNWSQGVFNQPWRGTSQYRFPIIPHPPDRTPDIRERWIAMQGHSREQQYLRHFAIENNLLEMTFALTSKSVRRLIREGFIPEAVEFLPESALQDTTIITDILRDSLKALDLITSITQDTSRLTVELLVELHGICMRTSNVLPVLRKAVPDTTPDAQIHTTEIHMEMSEFELKYTNVMLTRQATKKNILIAGPPRVQFCPFEGVISELERFVHLAKQWLKNWPRNPFASAAWLHLVIATIHPFENGNGRVARLIASIPLIKADLPPLCILSNAALKKDYFEAIGNARDDDYTPLIQVFTKSLEASIGMIEMFE